MPRIKPSAAETIAQARRAIAMRYGHTDAAHRWSLELLRQRASTLETEAARLRREAEELERTGPAA